ncbi:hypothetical protein Q3G72_026906 [Acer saccharum]|nr:hypothetical protein Q3G72_026906 [Acer saccharum]
MNPDLQLLSTVVLIESRLRCTPQKQRVRGYCIFKTPSCLQEIEDLYTIPQVVSLGLYHFDPFEFINEAKFVYLKSFLWRSRHNIDHFIGTLNGLFDRIVHCYQQSESSSSKVKDKEEQRKKKREITKLTPPEVSIIMLSDGAFLIEFLRRHIIFQDQPLLQDPQDPIFSKGWLVHGVFLDMIKMENQILFFVLQSLAEEWFGEEELFRMLFRLLKYYNGLDSEYESQFSGGVHILEFFSNIMFSFSSDHDRSHDNGNHDQSFTYTMPSVTQLLKSGIKLNTIASSSPISNINYNKNTRVLCIPKITLNQATCILITNTVAYELCRDDRVRYCADYVFFMHRLLKEPTDVELVLEAGVLTFGSVEDWRVPSGQVSL